MFLRLRYAFAGLSPLGKGVAMGAAIWVTGWVVGSIGFQSLAGSLGSVALTVFAVVATALVMKLLWTRHTSSFRRGA